MLDPTNITNYERTERELQGFWLFSIITAGKNAEFAAQRASDCLRNSRGLLPFTYLSQTNILDVLLGARTGQYTRISRAIEDTIKLLETTSLSEATVEQLMEIYGVGPKTARFFVLHTRPNQRYVVLDTHILSWLRKQGATTLTRTPAGESYKRLERIALELYDAHYHGMSPAEADLLIWTKESGRDL